MQIVIEIPESVKQAFDKATEDDIYGCYYDHNSIIGRAIKNGVPIELCEDAISRAEAIRIASGYCHWTNIPDELAKLPSVTPKQKMDKLSVIYRDDGTHNPPMFEKPECPSCGYELGKLLGYPFCPKCGQALDWEDKE